MGILGSRPGRLLIAGLAIVALAAGCGGGGASTGSTETDTVQASTTVATSFLSKPQFVAQVKEICREGWADIRGNIAEFGARKSSKLSAREAFAKTTRNYVYAGMDFDIFDKIVRLGAPQGEEARVEEVVGTMQAGIERGEGLYISTPRQLAALFAPYNRLAIDYGVDDCVIAVKSLHIG